MKKPQHLFDSYLSHYFSNAANQATFRATKKAYLAHNYESYLPANLESKILDIGPGFGELLEWLVLDRNYLRVSAVDLSREVVEYCNSIVPESTELIEDSSSFLNTSGQGYDLIFMMHVLEHVKKDEIIPLLKSIHRSLNRDGHFIVEVPNMGAPITGLHTRYADFTHEVGFTDTSLLFALKSAGFHKITIMGNQKPRDRWFRHLQNVAQAGFRLSVRGIEWMLGVRGSRILTPAIYAIADK